MAFRENFPSVRTIITDREFESLLQRTSAIFKSRDSRIIKFPGKSDQKRSSSMNTR